MLYPLLILGGLYVVSQSGGTTKPPVAPTDTRTTVSTAERSIASDVANALIAASRAAAGIVDAYNNRTSTTG